MDTLCTSSIHLFRYQELRYSVSDWRSRPESLKSLMHGIFDMHQTVWYHWKSMTILIFQLSFTVFFVWITFKTCKLELRFLKSLDWLSFNIKQDDKIKRSYVWFMNLITISRIVILPWRSCTYYYLWVLFGI